MMAAEREEIGQQHLQLAQSTFKESCLHFGVTSCILNTLNLEMGIRTQQTDFSGICISQELDVYCNFSLKRMHLQKSLPPTVCQVDIKSKGWLLWLLPHMQEKVTFFIQS